MRPFKTIALLVLLTITRVNSHAQNCTLTCPSNIIVNVDPGKEGAIVNFPSLKLMPECGTPTFTPTSGSFFRLGSTSVTLTTTSGQKCSFTVTVGDNEPPSLSPITLSRTNIWPASAKMKKVVVHYTASDNSGNVKTVLTVKSNTETTVDDTEIIDDHLVRLKASRLPDDSPRIYTITVTATDEAGNKTTRTTSIAVSRTMVAVK